MPRIVASTLLLLVVSCLANAVAGSTETIWSSVVITRNGDSIPLISEDLTTLTPLGAQQLFEAGAFFRDRYIAPTTFGDYIINGISTYSIDNTQIFSISTQDEYVLASAQAFIQGLYPPLNNSFSSEDPLITSLSLLANGSNIAFPLGGYQYPFLYSFSPNDPYNIWLSGQQGCNGYFASADNYFTEPDYLATAAATEAFYTNVSSSIFGGELPVQDISYKNAYYLFDYISYGYTHNQTIRDRISEDELARFRTLADQREFAVNGNLSANGYTQGDRIRTIGGQTLAAQVLAMFQNNLDSNGSNSKLNVLFTPFNPMISLVSLLGLPAMYEQFFGLPELGSSLVFELFSGQNVSSDKFPDPSQLQVRFLSRNGTNSSMNLDLYPIFGNPEESAAISLSDFSNSISSICVPSVWQWCDICQSESVFCPALTNSTNDSTTNSGDSPASKPFVAGIIGAIIALAFAAKVLVIAMLCFRVRFHRRPKPTRRNGLGGFKGAEKMASDPDLTATKGGAGATVIGKGNGPDHERVGSWELGDVSKAKDFGARPEPLAATRSSFEADEDDIHGEPVKVDDRV
ncbi:hypothetical protein MMC13_001945 [Lambiella insularis]|nr:hypothetical protein [Lambiella insularis]